MVLSQVSHPSMEPPPFGGGNLADAAPAVKLEVPSMEPPPFGGGNVWGSMNLSTPKAAFNGATPFRRWKLAAVGHSARYLKHLQWSHPLSAVEIMRDGSDDGEIE